MLVMGASMLLIKAEMEKGWWFALKESKLNFFVTDLLPPSFMTCKSPDKIDTPSLHPPFLLPSALLSLQAPSSYLGTVGGEDILKHRLLHDPVVGEAA